MERNGFTLVEVIVVVAIIGILLAIGTLQFSRYSMKANMEAQVKTMYSDLLAIRTQALFRKRERAIVVSGTNLSVYSSSVVTGTPPKQTTLKHQVAYDTSTVTFDSRGVASGPMAVCIEPSGNPAALDSIVIKPTGIQMGKRTGGGCASGNIVIQ